MHRISLNREQEVDLRVIFFFGKVSKKGESTQMNGNVFASRGILRIVVCSGAETELGALFQILKKVK